MEDARNLFRLERDFLLSDRAEALQAIAESSADAVAAFEARLSEAGQAVTRRDAAALADIASAWQTYSTTHQRIAEIALSNTDERARAADRYRRSGLRRAQVGDRGRGGRRARRTGGGAR